MNKYLKKFGIMFVMALILSLGFCVSAFAGTDDGVIGTSNLNGTTENSAVVGNILKAPEIGWKRYDDSNSNISYTSDFISGPNSSCYNNTIHQVFNNSKPEYARFNFTGTKIRLISILYNPYPNYGYIKIDGVEQKFNIKNNLEYQVMLFEAINLSNQEHVVEIYQKDNSNIGLDVDAIDIDKDGQLLPYNESITLNHSSMDLTEGDSGQLTATTTPAEVGVTWTVSDPTVATIEVDPTNGKITKVTALKEGTCTITATTDDGNNLSASCVINVTKKDEPSNPTDPEEPTDKTGATLIINLTDGETKVFDVSATEAAKFKEWYNTKTEYENQITYEFDKTVNSSISVEEDVVHDQVTSYEIRKY